MTSSDLDLRLLRFRSRRDEVPHALASALIEAGRSSDALEVIHLGLLDDERDIDLVTLEGRAYYAQGDLPQAQRSLLRAARIDPRHKEPYRWLAQVLIERGDAVRAVQVLERALGLDPSDGTLKQALTRAQRLVSLNAQRPVDPNAKRASEPNSEPPAKLPRPSLRNSVASSLASPERARSLTPSALGTAAARPAANQNAPMRGEPRASAPQRSSERGGPRGSEPRRGSEPVRPSRPSGELPWDTQRSAEPAREPKRTSAPTRGASPSTPATRGSDPPWRGEPRRADTRGRASEPSKPAERRLSDRPLRGEPVRSDATRASAEPALRSRGREIAAQDLLKEPLTDPGTAWDPARSALGRTALPFEEEVERDDEAPTTAVEIPEELRSRLRMEGGLEDVLPSDDSVDEEGELTSIVPAARELELLEAELRAPASTRAARSAREEDRTQEVQDEHLQDVELAAPGLAEPPEEVLKVLQRQGVFEPPAAAATRAPEAWLPSAELPRAGTPIKRALAVGWGLALVAALAGYYGFQHWLDGRRGDAAELVARGLREAADGQHESLASAERSLLDARALDPRSVPALDALLFVQAMRALDDGDAPFGPLRESVARADQMQVKTPMAVLARKLMQPAEQRKQELAGTLAFVEQEARQDAAASYLVARIAQRAGQSAAALPLLERANSLSPELAAAWIARGELARAEGQLEQAHEAFEKALGPDHQALRAELWLALLDARSSDGGALREKLEALTPRLARGSQSERLLGVSARAFAELARGDTEAAQRAFEEGADLHVDDPELLAFFSEQALRAGQHALAYRAARAASNAGGDAPRYQGIVAAALLQQGDGDAALTALANLGGEGHGALALARASAALLSDARDALEAAKKELASYRLTPAGKDDPEASSLLMRVDLRLGANVESLLPAARALVQRAPDRVASHLALAEALVKGGQGQAAALALEAALKLAPGSADAHYLLGRAQVLVGKPLEARASFERAVAIAPNHVEARRALGRALLDAGEFDAALALFRSLERAAGAVAGLGMVEGLLGKGNLAEASARFAALPEPALGSAPAQLLRARLELARGEYERALKTLEPLLAEDAESRTAEALALQGDVFAGANKADAAIASYEAALELDETQPDALIGRAQAALAQNRADTALQWIARADAALVLRPRPPQARSVLLTIQGRVALLKGDAAGARDKLVRALALPGAQPEAVFWYAEALSKAKAQQEANEQYARYLSLAPNGPNAARAKKLIGAH